MKKVAVVVGAGTVLALAVVATLKAYTSEAMIVLTETASTPCMPSYPQALGNSKNKKVTWLVKNECKSPQLVEFRDFRRRHFINEDEFDAIDNSIVDPYPSGGGGVTVPSTETRPIEAKIQKGPKWKIFSDTYKYDIYLNGAKKLDPDVEIWP